MVQNYTFSRTDLLHFIFQALITLIVGFPIINVRLRDMLCTLLNLQVISLESFCNFATDTKFLEQISLTIFQFC